MLLSRDAKFLAFVAVLLFLGAAFGESFGYGTAGLVPLGLAAFAGAFLVNK